MEKPQRPFYDSTEKAGKRDSTSRTFFIPQRPDIVIRGIGERVADRNLKEHVLATDERVKKALVDLLRQSSLGEVDRALSGMEQAQKSDPHKKQVDATGEPDEREEESTDRVIVQEKIQSHGEFEHMLEALDMYIPVLKHQPFIYEYGGTTYSGAIVDRIYGQDLESMPINAETEEIFDMFLEKFSKYMIYLIKNPEDTIDHFSLSKIMYGHRVNQDETPKESDGLFFTGMRPNDDKRDRSMLLSNVLAGILEDLQEKMKEDDYTISPPPKTVKALQQLDAASEGLKIKSDDFRVGKRYDDVRKIALSAFMKKLNITGHNQT